MKIFVEKGIDVATVFDKVHTPKHVKKIIKNI